MTMTTFTLHFGKISAGAIAQVGGKNASLGELYRVLRAKGIRVPEGFATTAEAYRALLRHNAISADLHQVLDELDRESFRNLPEVGKRARALLRNARIPDAVAADICDAYRQLASNDPDSCPVAVRSSATAEDLPDASFAGQLESFLNIRGEEQLLRACRHCFASLYTDRAIKYRIDKGYDHHDIALSVGVQRMVRADLACAGVAFTLEPETGFRDLIVISGAWGLGENVVQGSVTPDEFTVFKPSLRAGRRAVITHSLGSKELTCVFAAGREDPASGTRNIATPRSQRESFVLDDGELSRLAECCLLIEEHYGRPMDIEWAKDGLSGEISIVQARPETVQSRRQNPYVIHRYELQERSRVLTLGVSLGDKIAAGRARLLQSPAEADRLQVGDVLVTGITNPDWDPIMKKAAAIVTDHGGRTSHAAIVARELGTVAVVGCGDATAAIRDGQELTVSCAEGQQGIVYDAILPWREQKIDLHDISLPATECMLILADPANAYTASLLPNKGVGLLRMEFIISNSIRVHPMALVAFEELRDLEAREAIEALTRRYKRKQDYFVEKLAEAVATIAAAFYPKDVIVRMSDFKSNEYGSLLGGRQFELEEQNPMIGFRGAARYYHPRYREAFRLECEAMKLVRDAMGLENVKLMIPFCRTPAEGRQVVKLMAANGLQRGRNGLEIYVMIELPGNVVMADQLAAIFDGFSIGSNDLTQLTLGLDRDSELISELFNERDDAVTALIAQVIASARRTGTKIGLCGQAPSDDPEFARFLVRQGIDSISFTPDALIRGIANVCEAELMQAGNETLKSE